MDIPYTVGVSRNGHGLVCRFLSSGGAGEPNDSILVSIDMNALQAGYMLCGQLGLDSRCDGRILHEDHRMRAVSSHSTGRHGSGGSEDRDANQAGYCNSRFHDLSILMNDLDARTQSTSGRFAAVRMQG